jgi:hypothetical protein
MEGFRKALERRLLRCCERHRLEDQLLLLAYEQVRPLIRKRHKQAATQPDQQRHEETRKQTPSKRSA